MTVTINGSGTMTGLAVGGLNDNIITKNEMATGGAWAPAGTVLQVVNTPYSTTVSSSSATWADTGLAASITPTSSSSKILVLVDMAGCNKNATNTYLQLRLLRNSTTLYQFDDLSGYTNSAQYNAFGSPSTNYLDSPATTSSTTYKVQFANGGAVGGVAINNTFSGTSTSTITLMEIAA